MNKALAYSSLRTHSSMMPVQVTSRPKPACLHCCHKANILVWAQHSSCYPPAPRSSRQTETETKTKTETHRQRQRRRRRDGDGGTQTTEAHSRKRRRRRRGHTNKHIPKGGMCAAMSNLHSMDIQACKPHHTYTHTHTDSWAPRRSFVVKYRQEKLRRYPLPVIL